MEKEYNEYLFTMIKSNNKPLLNEDNKLIAKNIADGIDGPITDNFLISLSSFILLTIVNEYNIKFKTKEAMESEVNAITKNISNRIYRLKHFYKEGFHCFFCFKFYVVFIYNC